MSRIPAETAPEIEISIDALVLSGFSHVDRARLNAALRGELGRLLQDPKLASALRNLKSVAQLDLGPLRGAASPEQLGVQVARTLVRSCQPAAPPMSPSRTPVGAAEPEKGKRP